MTRRSPREIERCLGKMGGDEIDSSPGWFREWHSDRSESWIREEWHRVVRRADEHGTDLMASAWIRDLKQCYNALEKSR